MSAVIKLSGRLPFLIWLKQSNRSTLGADLIAGLTGAILVLPQGVAYAFIAGLPPEYGLYTAIVTAIVASLFGSSHHMISGPAAAISIVVMSVASAHSQGMGVEHYVGTVLAITLLAGLMQLALGLLRLGNLVNFISHTVVIGFTAGAALLIAASQLKYLTGIAVEGGASFVGGIVQITERISALNPYSLGVGLVTLVVALVVRKINRRLPHLLLGMLAGSLLCYWIDGAARGVELVGALPGTLPQFALPNLSFEQVQSLASGAFALAMLGLIEAVSIARAIALRSHQRIDGNQEFIGQGLSNIVGSFFSCYAGSGSFTRSGANYDAGARTPLAAVFAALGLALIILTLPSLTAYLPLPAMAGSILLIAWNLIDFKHIRGIFKAGRSEVLILSVTLLATLLVELEFAIYMGILTSLVSYLMRTSQPRVIAVAPIGREGRRLLRNVERYQQPQCPQLRIARVDGSLYFGSINHVQTSLRAVVDTSPEIRCLILNGKGINFIDLAGMEYLAQECRYMEGKGVQLFISSLKGTVVDELKQRDFLEHIGVERFFDTTDKAISACENRLDKIRCVNCDKNIYRECPC
ncbi:SulP family inorganic anion transporter [Marinobacterium lutimaris]|uniref:Sulfate permease, SulP family n=1 Tax=Marinobacterium lutimaris TaxID=568106 RepID=A0A1H6C298_9GAMM|nr:SulP family inorganic anion transporter [Marinobacterium lutimaris]SEG66775.1 sulfate permease, SulP family [Marinobacterium lutimaris]